MGDSLGVLELSCVLFVVVFSRCFVFAKKYRI